MLAEGQLASSLRWGVVRLLPKVNGDERVASPLPVWPLVPWPLGQNKFAISWPLEAGPTPTLPIGWAFNCLGPFPGWEGPHQDQLLPSSALMSPT
jgi:hypothetical protein